MINRPNYILQKDLPYIKAGTEYVFANGFNGVPDRCSYVPNKMGMMHERFAIHVDYIENNPEWFKLKEGQQPKEDKIEVESLHYEASHDYYWFRTKYKLPQIPPEKYEAVKKAIEREINNEPGEWLKEFTKKQEQWFNEMQDKVWSDTIQQKYYTEKELLEAEQKAFETAITSIKTYKDAKCEWHLRYPKFSDYKNQTLNH